MKKPLYIGFVVLLLLSFAMVIPQPASAGLPAQAIWVEPASAYLQKCGNFTVDVKINITDPPGPATGLYGFQYKLKWNSTVLEWVEIQTHTDKVPSTDILTGWTNIYIAANTTGSGPPKAPEGFNYHSYAVSATGGVAFTGVASLCTYTFHVLGNGSCALDIYDDILVDDTATTIDHTTVDGYFSDPYPRARFTYSPEFPLVNETVTFNATDSYDPDGTIVSYAWDFGDGTPIVNETDPITIHNYTAAGSYTVKLAVTDDDALTGTIIKVVKVGGIAALFTYSPSNPLVNETVTFNANASFSRTGYIVNYTWNFGDSNTTTTTSPIINHTYIAAGIYNMNLTVIDNASLTDTRWDIVKVGRWPVAKFTIDPLKPLVNQTVYFLAGDSHDTHPDQVGAIVSYAWDFGDGTPLITKMWPNWTITHNYTTFGTRNVTLTVTDNETLSNSTSRLITVFANPVANFTWSPTVLKVGDTVTFNASASYDPDGTISGYDWNFGDGSIKADIVPIINHTYTSAGTFTVTLTVTDSDGTKEIDRHKDTTAKSITIEKLSSSISIFVSPETIKVGENTTISGSISVQVAANVTIHYRLAGETWNTITVTTNSTGGYSYSWKPEKAGNYEVYASWPGDTNTEPAESDHKTVTVKEAAAPPYLLYAAIVIIIIIVAAIAIYFLKIRKS